MFEKHAAYRFKLHVEEITLLASQLPKNGTAALLLLFAHTAGPSLAADLQTFKQQRPPPHRLWRPQTGA